MLDVTTLDDYLQRYGTLLGQQAQASINPLHVPGRDQSLKLRTVRPLFDAQAHVAKALVKALDRQKSVMLVAEMGTGKTIVSIASAHAHARDRPYKALVFCPDQICPKWGREIKETLPDVDVIHVQTYRDIVGLADMGRPVRPTWWIISRDRAKLGAKWRASYAKNRKGAPVCSRCHAPVVDKDGNYVPHEVLERKKHWCQADAPAQSNGFLARDSDGNPIPCGEPLWTYTSELDRWEPARYIQRRLKHFFDYLILDEAHEEKSATSAQGLASGSLAAACKKVIALTGTLIGGYADHVRPLLYRLSPGSLVQEGLGWSDGMQFNERYGRIETRVVEKEGGDDHSESRGSKTTKTKYVRPGIMPALFGRHLMQNAIFLSLSEVAANLPAYRERVIACELDAEQAAAYREVEDTLRLAIRDMLYRGDKRLLGTMLHVLLSYPDYPFDWDWVGYKNRDGSFVPVVKPENLPAETIRPKEQALLDLCRREVAEGRQCWVYVEMTDKRDVLARLEALLKDAGLRVKVMRASVPLAQREEWITKQGRTVDVVLSHPVLVQTGLDLFDKRPGGHNYVSLIWYETGYHLFTLRQASRRSWRIGQRQECRVYYLYYADTMQARAMTLMGKKLSASQALEGRFTSEGLAAMGGEDGSVEMALAKSLAENLQDLDAKRAWEKIVDVRFAAALESEEPVPTIPEPEAVATMADEPVVEALTFERLEASIGPLGSVQGSLLAGIDESAPSITAGAKTTPRPRFRYGPLMTKPVALFG